MPHGPCGQGAMKSTILLLLCVPFTTSFRYLGGTRLEQDLSPSNPQPGEAEVSRGFITCNFLGPQPTEMFSTSTPAPQALPKKLQSPFLSLHPPPSL